uniref:DNA-directed RNA polymerase subunit beta n=1 Tax=Prototheca cutis TaxID=575411 RepID=A0A2Z6BEQ2_9CHLO|nr:beta subunit of rna polymerase [Prototheca cutis]BBD20198.1 beta subunit of rna polymerase [Prototheca cutis]
MEFSLKKKVSFNLTKKSIDFQLEKHSVFFDDILNPLLFFYLKVIAKKNKSKIIKELPHFLNAQQLSFMYFLKIGIKKAFDTRNPFSLESDLFSYEIFYFSKYLQIQKPIITKKEAILLKETFGASLYVPVLIKSKNNFNTFFDWINIGFLPFMIKPGHFIINGISRVAMNQLIRAPGVYKLINSTHTTKGIRVLPELRVVPDRGSWIQIYFDSKKRIWITTKIFQTQVSYLVFLQALNFHIFRLFSDIQQSEILYASRVPSLTSTNLDTCTRHDIVLMRAGLRVHPNTREEAYRYLYAHYLEYELQNDNTKITNETAFFFFWQYAWNSANRFLGNFGRQQFIKIFNTKDSFHNSRLTTKDFIFLTQTLIFLYFGKELGDDIDNLDNKKIQSCGDFLYQELLQTKNLFEGVLNYKLQNLKISNEIKKDINFLNNRFNIFWEKNKKNFSKSLTKSWHNFFIGGTLSQYLDETNPLAEITHKRRITFLGPGGVNTQQATIQIRGIHPTYYGRICPIETPEGENAGLVLSFTVLAQKTINGKILTPFYKIFKGQAQTDMKYMFLNPSEEMAHVRIPADIITSKWNRLPSIQLPVRKLWTFDYTSLNDITAQSISSLQMISIATSLIPFLEHDDANRALMGSNMQRQAVALVSPEVALVKTGLEVRVVSDSVHFLQTSTSGFITQVCSNFIQLYKPKLLKNFCYIHFFFNNKDSIIINRIYPIIYSFTILSFYSKIFPKYHNIKQKVDYLQISLNNSSYVNTLINKQKEIYFNIKLTKNSLTSFLLIKNTKTIKKFDSSNSIKYRTNYKTFVFDTYKQTNQSICAIRRPHVYEATWVEKSDILADGGISVKGKLAIGKNLLVAYIPWEGYNYEDAVLINENLVSKNILTSLHLDSYQIQNKKTKTDLEIITKDMPFLSKKELSKLLNLDSRGIIKKGTWVKEGDYLVGKVCITHPKGISENFNNITLLQSKKIPMKNTSFRVPKGVEGLIVNVETFSDKNQIFFVRVSILQRRKIQIGDKIAGRHGNKGVISKIVPSQDMPFLPDGTPVDIVLNPLGIPSRMNVGQILECLLGLAGKYLHESFEINLFDEKFGIEASRSFVFSKLYEASVKTKNLWLFNPQHPGKIQIFDGRTGIAFQQPVTVGYTYILKLIHMVDDKIHARATGPYSVITQQPVKGRANRGGQRLGEMEVWALQAYGAAYTLQELLTLKSDDLGGRNKATLQVMANTPVSIQRPESIKLLLREIQALCLNFELYISSSHSKKICLVDLNNIDTELF